MPDLRLTLTVLAPAFSICRLEPDAPIPAWAESQPFCCFTRTPEELSLVVPSAVVPYGTRCEHDWKCLKVGGPLEFSQVGILAALVSPLARASISIFSVSTFDTDYLFVRERDLEIAIVTLSREGHWISRKV